MENTKAAFWFFVVMGLVLLTGLAAALMEPSADVRLALLAWQQLLFIVGGFLGSKREHYQSISLRRLVQGLVCGVGLYFLNILVGALTFAAFAQFLGSGAVRELLLRDRAPVEMLITSEKPFVAWGAVLLLLVGAPLGEELFFRGLLVSLLRSRLGALQAVLLAGLLFALMHFYLLQFVPVLVSGIVLGLLFVRSDSIYVPIAAHLTVTALALLALLSSL